MDNNTEPSIAQSPFDHYAFNCLAAIGAIEAFHAGNKTIYVSRITASVIKGSSPFEALRKQGWKFMIILETESISV